MAALDLIRNGCAIDADDGVRVTDAGHQRVVRFDGAGELTDEIGDADGTGVYARAPRWPDGRPLPLCGVPDFSASATGVDTDKATPKTAWGTVPHGRGP